MRASTWPQDEQRLAAWLAQGRHGTMEYMAAARHAPLAAGRTGARHDSRDQRAHGLPGRRGAIPTPCCTIPLLGYVSRYALGRDYHKVLRHRLARLAERIAAAAGTAGYRAFTDSAPVLEKALARDAGLGWIGKHTNLLDRHDGSWFFLGEIYTDLPLPVDAPVSCALRLVHRLHRRVPDAGDRRAVRTRRATLHLVPDDRARRARSRKSSARRSAIASTAATTASSCARGTAMRRSRPNPTSARGTGSTRRAWSSCFAGARTNSCARTEGSAIRRIGYERWLRNVAVALGNAPRYAGR